MPSAPIPDRTILRNLEQALTSRGLRAPCRVIVAVHAGVVTLSGTIQYEHQRALAKQVAGGVQGVKRVNDQLQVIAKTSHWN
jgi:osmotically-inducible protein OsmY